MGRQILLIATIQDIRNVIEEAKKRYNNLYVCSECIMDISECIPSQCGSLYVKIESVRNPKIVDDDSRNDFDAIQLNSSYMVESGFYEYGRIYIMTSQLVTTDDGYFFEKQDPELMKVYNTLVAIVKKMCVVKYGDKYRIYYALPDGDKFFYPMHEMLEVPIYSRDNNDNKWK